MGEHSSENETHFGPTHIQGQALPHKSASEEAMNTNGNRFQARANTSLDVSIEIKVSWML